MSYECDQERRRPSVTASLHYVPAISAGRRLIVALAFLAPTTTGSFAAPANHVIIIRQMRFNPAQITVAAGDTVEWKNEDIFSHTVTANDGTFDSGLIRPNSSWQTLIRSVGRVAYHCRPHPNMVAQLDVQPAGEDETRGQNGRPAGEHGGSTLAWKLPTKPDDLHPILVNFTAALLPIALLSDVLGRVFRRSSLQATGFWLVLYAAVITPFTALAGWWWKTSTHVSSEHPVLMPVHQWLGSAAAVLFVLAAIWRWRIHKRGVPPSIQYLAFMLLIAIALVYQGSLGGEMAFGH